MGQKIHPTGFRLAVTRNWSSRWYAGRGTYAATLHDDIRVREFLRKKLKNASGVVIGKKGEDIENLKAELQKMMKVPVHVNIEEIRKPETDAQLIADSITQQLERRIMFRRAMKRAMQNAMRLGALGIKLMSSGRLNGAEIARTEWYREGRVPLHTLRADIEYGFSEANTTYGIIGVKCWVYKGDTLGRNELAAAEKEAAPTERDDRRGRRGPPGGRGPGRGEGRGPRADAAAPGAGAPAGVPGGSEGRPADRQRVRRAAPAADAVKSE